MEFVVITGPPAVGKLTVGTILSKMLGFRLFHNHLTFDAAISLFDYGTPDFFRLCDELRFVSISAAARAGIPGMVFTFCLATEGDQRFMDKCASYVESEGGKCHFVVLDAPVSVLEERVKAQGRERYAKTRNVDDLRRLLAAYKFNSLPHNRNGLRLDTSEMSADVAAHAITKHIRAGMS